MIDEGGRFIEPLQSGALVLGADRVIISVMNFNVPGAHTYGSVHYSKATYLENNEFICGGGFTAKNPLFVLIQFGPDLDADLKKQYKFEDGTFKFWLRDETAGYYYQELVNKEYYDSLIFLINAWRWIIGLPPIKTTYQELLNAYNLTQADIDKSLYYISVFRDAQPPGYTSEGIQTLAFHTASYGPRRKGTAYKLSIAKVGVEYIGGQNPNDGLSEDYTELLDEYFMRGYMLKVSLSNQFVEANTPVTWNITKNNAEVGTYHNGGTWTDYAAPVAKPTTTTVYWRSDTVRYSPLSRQQNGKR